MPYTKQNFVNQEIDADGNVIQEGTVLTAEHLNHIEEGIIDINRQGIPSLMTVKVEEKDKMIIRCRDWSEDRDFVWEFSGICGTNKTANLWYSCTIAKSLEDTALEWGIGNKPTKSELYKATTDDTAPVQFCGSYFGGNHAMTGSTDFTAASHKITEADIGSVWKDSDPSDPREYMLVRIKSSSSLAFINLDEQVTSGNGAFNYAKHNPVAPLVHVRNATHTEDINFTAYTNSQQLHPGANNISNKYYVDDIEITQDGIYHGAKVHNVCTYNIIYVPSIISFLEANVGHNTNASYYSDDIKDKYMQIEIIHEFRPNGSQTTYCKYMIDQRMSLNFSYIYAAQVAPFEKPAYFYAPGSYEDNLFLHDGSSTIQFKPDTWNIEGIPPCRYFTFNSTKTKGFQIVYNTNTYVGKPEFRSKRVNSGSFAGWSPGTCKLYPIFTKGTYPAGASFDSVTGRIPLKDILKDGVTSVGWYWEHDDIILTVDSHEVCNTHIKLSEYMRNKRVEILSMSDSVISYPPYRTSDTLHYATNSDKGHIVLRLYD